MNDSDDRGGLTALPVDPARSPIVRTQAVPEGKLEVIVTSLEMTQRPTRPTTPAPAEQHALMRAQPPTTSFYRYLYHAVGEPWLWYERSQMDDETLRAIIEDPDVGVYVLYVRGSPAGYVELDRRLPDDVELAYFGLVPEFIGRGFGRYFLEWAVEAAWSGGPKRVWVHTCNLDHPRAFALYQRSGFVPYKQEILVIDDPRRDSAGPTET